MAKMVLRLQKIGADDQAGYNTMIGAADLITELAGLVIEYRDAPDTMKIREWEALAKRAGKALEKV